jgi:hypothetical protein
VLKHIAVDDQVCFARRGISGGRDSGCRFHPGDIVNVRLRTFDEPEDEVPVIAAMIENTYNPPLPQMFLENWTKLRATSTVMCIRREISIELRGIPRFSGATHPPVFFRPILTIEIMQVRIVETRIVKDETT